MGYQEYFNYANCTQQTSYTNYGNTCFTSYYNYSNCEVSSLNYADCETCWITSYGKWSYINTYYNYSNCEVSYTNYPDCEVSYNNYSNDCVTYTNYTNHINYSNPNSGAPITLDWSTPWGGWSGDTLPATYIAESINALKQIRYNIRHLEHNKGQHTVTTDTDPASPNVGDPEFDPPGPDYVEDNQWQALKSSLDSLWNAIAGQSSGLPDKFPGDEIFKADWENLKVKTDQLAQYDASAAYANHSNYANFTHTNYTENVTR